MRKEIMAIILDNAKCEKLEDGMRLQDITDSLDYCNMIWELEEEMGRDVPDDKVKFLYHGTVAELLDYLTPNNAL